MNKAEILGLAARIEALEGPDREVHAAIFRAIDAPVPAEFAGKKIALTFDEARHAFFVDVGSDMVVRYDPPAYTSSIDAATSLFPADCFYRSGHDGAGPDVTMFFCDAIASDAHGLPLRGVRAVALTEPCARTAAALRAIASTMEDDRG